MFARAREIDLLSSPLEIHEQFFMLSAMLSCSRGVWKGGNALFPPLAWVTAERHVSSDERRRVSLQRIWLTLSDSSVPGQFRHTDIKHIKRLSQHFTWHCSSVLICYSWRGRFSCCFKHWMRATVKTKSKKWNPQQIIISKINKLIPSQIWDYSCVLSLKDNKHFTETKKMLVKIKMNGIHIFILLIIVVNVTQSWQLKNTFKGNF